MARKTRRPKNEAPRIPGAWKPEPPRAIKIVKDSNQTPVGGMAFSDYPTIILEGNKKISGFSFSRLKFSRPHRSGKNRDDEGITDHATRLRFFFRAGNDLGISRVA
jgi:hypothetical protein